MEHSVSLIKKCVYSLKKEFHTYVHTRFIHSRQSTTTKMSIIKMWKIHMCKCYSVYKGIKYWYMHHE